MRALGLSLSLSLVSVRALAAAPADPTAPNADAGGLSQEQVEAYLDSHALPKSPGLTADGVAGDRVAGDQGGYAEAPPPPPRHRGVVLEASPGVYFPLGAMGHVSPPSPWLQIDVGYELSTWFMVLGHADLTMANTSYAAQPPPPRTFAQYGVGAAGRFQHQFTDWFAAHLQVEVGVSEVTEDVLHVYGFADADTLGPFYGARLGLEWLQVNPHTAVVLHGTLRDYPTLHRTNDQDPTLSLIGALSLRYAF
jgi:hypothetical protein